MKKILAFVVLFTTNFAFAQHADVLKYRQKLKLYEDSLKTISHQVINNPEEPERYNFNYKLIKTLVNALKVPGSFNYSFDSLKSVSILTSADMRFKIFTWHVMNNDGSYRFYGTVQMNNPNGKLKLFPLVDYSPKITNPGDTVTTNEKWYGTQYYKIIPVTYNVPRPYYVLLGWKGNNSKSTKKVIDVLYFKDDKAMMGMPIFEGNKEFVKKNRIVFEYSRQVSMLLNYIPKEGKIIFDHLAPPDPKMKGKFDMYGPDMSYNGFKLLNGKWKYVEDLVLKNDPSERDAQFNDPKKPVKKIQRKLAEY